MPIRRLDRSFPSARVPRSPSGGPDRDEQHPLAQDQAQHVPRAGAHSHPDAELADPQVHHVGEQPEEADHGDA